MAGVSFTYPSLVAGRSLRYVCTRGVFPDAIIMEIIPQATLLPANGDVAIIDDGLTVTLRDCRLDSSSIRYDSTGQITYARLWDRRWWWRYGKINGCYNVRRPDGSIDPATTADLRSLATLCLNAAGETGFDVSAVSNTLFPFVDWLYDNPMQELEKLLHFFGYEVCWNPVPNTVTIEVANSGSTLPGGTDVETATYSVSTGERPSSIVVAGAPVTFQSKLKLEAVGLDTDGSIVPINSLSYTPADGWTYQLGTQFEDVADQFDEASRQCALESVFRWYRVVSQADGSQDVPGYAFALSDITQLLPIRPWINDVETGLVKQKYAKAFVQGIYLPPGGDPDAVANTAETQLLDLKFSMRGQLGLVIFPQQIVKLDGAGGIEAATLYLTCSYQVTETATNQPVRFERTTALIGAPANSGPYPYVNEDFRLVFAGRYANPSDVTDLTSTDSNAAAVQADADAAAALIGTQFGDVTGTVGTYRYLKDIRLGGKIWQVGWNVRMRTPSNVGGSNTIGGQQIEFEGGVLRGRERRRIIQSLFRERHQRRSLERTSDYEERSYVR